MPDDAFPPGEPPAKEPRHPDPAKLPRSGGRFTGRAVTGVQGADLDILKSARALQEKANTGGALEETARLATKLQAGLGIENASRLVDRFKTSEAFEAAARELAKGGAIDAAAREIAEGGAFSTGSRLMQAAMAGSQVDFAGIESRLGSFDRAKLEAIQAAIAPNVRTYPEIALEAQRRADAARALSTTAVVLPKMPSGEEVAIKALAKETRKQAGLMADIYDAIKLQSETAERQEAGIALVVNNVAIVVDELREGRAQAAQDGATIARLTRWLVAFTVGLFVLTLVIAWLTWGLVNAGG